MDLRPLLLEAGERLAERGMIAAAADVVYLEVSEVLSALEGESVGTDTLAGRKAEMEAAEDFRVPDLIVGDDFVPIPRTGDESLLRGVGSSRGRVRGTLRVVHDPTGVTDLAPGTVLAVPHSDVSWTPLFARAAGIVAEAGGMLSHSSIVAREFGIPCVVSVAGACDLPDGVDVVVDGYEGTVTVLR
jgi:pyruvate,water dikinase